MKQISKQAIIDDLSERGNSWYYTWWPLTWNIKVYDWSFSYASNRYDGIPIQDKWDDRWEAHLETSEGLHYFEWACEDWLGFAGHNAWWDVMEGHSDQAISDSQPVFYTEGRSGGWLVLDEATINGWRVKFCNSFRYPEDWDDPDNLSYADLWTLYKFCQEMDKIVSYIPDHMSYWYAEKRAELEREWDEQAKEDAARVEAPIGPYVMQEA